MPPYRTARHRLVIALAVASAILALMEAHALWFARQHLAAGDRARGEGNLVLARMEWETAASRAAPFNGYARESMGRLLWLEGAFEEKGEFAEALRVCFSMRGIARATSGYWSIHGDEGRYAEARIPELAKRLGTELSPDRYTLYRPVRDWAGHLAVLCFAGAVLAAFGAVRSAGPGQRGIRAGVAFGLFLLWLILLRAA